MSAAILVDDIRHRFGDRDVLSYVTLRIELPSIVAFLGPNGCGKTTLLRIIAGLLRPTNGRVEFNGRDVSTWPTRERAKKLAYLPQQPPHVLPYTVQEFVGFGRFPYHSILSNGTSVAAIERILAVLGIAALADAPVSELSGGEWQLVRFSRVIAQETDVLILDEPATALDPRHQDLIARLLLQLRGSGKTIVFSSHDPTFALRVSDRVVLFDSRNPLRSLVCPAAVTSEQLSHTYDVPMTIATVPGVGKVCCIAGGDLAEPVRKQVPP